MRLVLFFLVSASGIGQTCRSEQVHTSVQCCDGAMGSLFAQVIIRNDSRQECWLEGVPKVKVIERSGTAVAASVTGNADLDKYGKGSSRFRLRPGGRAAVSVATQAPDSDEARCGTRLEVDMNGVAVNFDMVACGPRQHPVRVFASGFHRAPGNQ